MYFGECVGYNLERMRGNVQVQYSSLFPAYFGGRRRNGKKEKQPPQLIIHCPPIFFSYKNTRKEAHFPEVFRGGGKGAENGY